MGIFLKKDIRNPKQGKTSKKGNKKKKNIQYIVIFCTFFVNGTLLGAIITAKSSLDWALSKVHIPQSRGVFRTLSKSMMKLFSKNN